jgi:hypothetical protein
VAPANGTGVVLAHRELMAASRALRATSCELRAASSALRASSHAPVAANRPCETALFDRSQTALRRAAEIKAGLQTTMSVSAELKDAIARGGVPTALGRALERCLSSLRADSAAVMIGSGRGLAGEFRASRQQFPRLLDDLELVLGEGPGTDIFATGLPVVVVDMSRSGSRWPVYAPAALEAGVSATFGLPLRDGHAIIGAFVVSTHNPGWPDTRTFHEAMKLADICSDRLITMQRQARTGQVALSLEPLIHRFTELNQAAGKVSASLGIAPPDALTLIRARLWRTAGSIADATEEIVKETHNRGGTAHRTWPDSCSGSQP